MVEVRHFPFILAGLVMLMVGCGKEIGNVVLPIAPTYNAYVGSETCGTCHADLYADFIKSGHPNKVRAIADAEEAPREGLPEIPIDTWLSTYASGLAQAGVNSKADLAFMIGGVNWKARFVNKEGYVIRGPNAQFNLVNRAWQKYVSDTWNGNVEKYDYKCFRCHTTGASPEGHLPGMPQTAGWGSFVFPGVQCERCHGMGFRHVNYREKPVITRDISLCAECHNRNTQGPQILASGNFVGHREQVNELKASRKDEAGVVCVSCHNPHKRAKLDLEMSLCESCHTNFARYYQGTMHDAANVTCIDCHMAETVKNGTARRENPTLGVFMGDGKSHLFRITPDPNYPMLVDNPDPATNTSWPKIMNTAPDYRGVPGPFITTGYACGKCHYNNTPQLFYQALVNTNPADPTHPRPHGLSKAHTPEGWVAP
ncbi:MAG: cytochrome c3 family protein [bacterium JZ-2024 1]